MRSMCVGVAETGEALRRARNYRIFIIYSQINQQDLFSFCIKYGII